MKRKAIAREQLIAQTDELLERTSSKPASEQRDRPDSRHSSHLGIMHEEETEIVDGDEDELFSDFKFRSFKRQK